MDVACSVVLIRYPIDIFLEKEKVSLDAGSVMLVARNIRGLFCAYADRVKMADISNSVVNQYLERVCELTEYTPTKMPLYLMSDIYNTELAEALITQHSESSDTLKDFSVITAFSCISLFATDRRLPLFLSGAVFHQYYGAPPESYAYLQKADVI